MSNATITFNIDNESPTVTGSGDPDVNASGNTISYTPANTTDTVLTVTLTPGTSGASNLTFTDSVVLPSVFGSGPATAIPLTVQLDNGVYVFTCTDRIPTNGTAVSGNFTVTTGSDGTIHRHDPTMIFNPPE